MFTISTDGKYAHYFNCPNFRCANLEASHAIRSCQKKSNGVPCRVFALKRKVVWQGEIGNNNIDSVKIEMELLRKWSNLKYEKLNGAFIYMPGYSHDKPIPRSNTSVPTYLEELNKAGWHTYKLFIVHEHRSTLTLDNQIEALRELVIDLKDKGFKRVIVAGQSAGGWLALRAAVDIPEVDGILAATPSKYGSKVDNKGSSNNRFNQSTDATLRLLRRVRDKQVMLAFFDGDPWEPADRARKVQALLTETGVPHIVIDHPKGIYGHHGAWSETFKKLYSSCLNLFFKGKVIAKDGCRKGGVELADFDPGDIDVSKLTSWEMSISEEALQVYKKDYLPEPLLSGGKYAYKFFAYSQGSETWGWGRQYKGVKPRTRAFEEALSKCHLKSADSKCQIYAIDNQVVGVKD